MLEDQLPVADVERGGDRGVPELRRLGGAEDRHPGDDDDEHQEEGGEQAPRPAQPEVDQPHVAAGHVGEQDVCDQVAAEGEEDPHAEQPARSPPEFQVIRDDGEHGDRSQPIEAGHVALAAPDWFRHG